MHLIGDADGFYISRINIGLCQNFLSGLYDIVPPVLRMLLGPAVFSAIFDISFSGEIAEATTAPLCVSSSVALMDDVPQSYPNIYILVSVIFSDCIAKAP